MSFRMMEWAWKQTDLPSSAKFTLLALANYANDRGEAWPSMPALATLMGYSPTSRNTIRQAIAVLEERGLVTTQARHRPGTDQQTSHLYRLNRAREESKSETELDPPSDTTPSVLTAPTPGADNTDPRCSQHHEPVIEPVTEPAKGSMDDPAGSSELDVAGSILPDRPPRTDEDPGRASNGPVSPEWQTSVEKKAFIFAVMQLAAARRDRHLENEITVCNWLDVNFETVLGTDLWGHANVDRGWTPPRKVIGNSYEAGTWLNKLLAWMQSEHGEELTYTPGVMSQPLIRRAA